MVEKVLEKMFCRIVIVDEIGKSGCVKRVAVC